MVREFFACRFGFAGRRPRRTDDDDDDDGDDDDGTGDGRTEDRTGEEEDDDGTDDGRRRPIPAVPARMIHEGRLWRLEPA